MTRRHQETATFELKPNRALRHVRQACGLSQGAFAKTLGVSAAYVQAIELGQRAASADFAEKVRDRTGAWHRSILENWPEAVDVNGHPYTSETYKRMLLTRPDVLEPVEHWQHFMEPMTTILKGASGAGKTSLAISIVRDKLREAAEHILLLEGVSDALVVQHLAAGKLTVGELRKHPELATLAGFKDDGARKDSDEILLYHGSTQSTPADDLLKNFIPVCAHHGAEAVLRDRRSNANERRKQDD